MHLKPLTDWLVYFLIRVFICVIQATPIDTCVGISRGLGVHRLRCGAASGAGGGRQPASCVSAVGCAHAASQCAADVGAPVRDGRGDRPRPADDSRNELAAVRGFPIQAADRELSAGPAPDGLVTGHYGNFEIAGYVLGMFGFPSFTIARKLDNPYLDRFVNQFRGSTGQFILPKQGCAPQVEAILQMGGILSLLGDQHAGDKGCWVEFLGRPASCHKAVALFTITSGAPLIVSVSASRGSAHAFPDWRGGCCRSADMGREPGGCQTTDAVV